MPKSKPVDTLQISTSFPGNTCDLAVATLGFSSPPLSCSLARFDPHVLDASPNSSSSANLRVLVCSSLELHLLSAHSPFSGIDRPLIFQHAQPSLALHGIYPDPGLCTLHILSSVLSLHILRLLASSPSAPPYLTGCSPCKAVNEKFQGGGTPTYGVGYKIDPYIRSEASQESN